jgi:DNA topoisomerase-1
LPAIRAAVETGLRRRTIDRDLVLAVMLRVLDRTGMRIGNEEYAEENDSYGLTTLHRRHVQVRGKQVTFCFRAKSGKQRTAQLTDPAVARVLRVLAERRGRRLFAAQGGPVGADELNERIAELAGARVTAKDFRTWHGTRIAFAFLRSRVPPPGDPEQRVLAAVDEAAEFLGNTRTVCRAHYVHPGVLQAYTDGRFGEMLAAHRPRRLPGLDRDERALLPFLQALLERGLSAS